MVLPVILGAAAAVCGAVGAGIGAGGLKRIRRANQTVRTASALYEENVSEFKRTNEKAIKAVQALNEKETEILSEIDGFFSEIKKSDDIYSRESVEADESSIHELLPDELGRASSRTAILIGSAGGTVLGTGCGIGAASAATAAVMALGTASTGTAISQLGGAAASNAALAALGGGAVAAGGGGMALGSVILGGSSLGTGLLAGGIIFRLTGAKVMEKAEGAWTQMRAAQDQLEYIKDHLTRVTDTANEYCAALSREQLIYRERSEQFRAAETDEERKTLADRTYQTVKRLYAMCGTRLLLPPEDENAPWRINEEGLRGFLNK